MSDSKQLAAVKTDVVEQLVPGLMAKTFSSGKDGFFAQGKLTVNGTRYQAQLMLVELQPK